MNPDEIRTLVRRLGRPHGEGTVIVEGVQIRAAGPDFDAVEEWILTHGGKRQEAVTKRRGGGGLYGNFEDREAQQNLRTARYLLPTSALEAPAEEAAEGQGSDTEDTP